jgi:hypothetical protein
MSEQEIRNEIRQIQEALQRLTDIVALLTQNDEVILKILQRDQ